MNCPKCQNFVDSSSLFCPVCGTSIHPILAQNKQVKGNNNIDISYSTEEPIRTVKNENYTVLRNHKGEFNLLSYDGKILYGMSFSIEPFSNMMYRIGIISVVTIILLYYNVSINFSNLLLSVIPFVLGMIVLGLFFYMIVFSPKMTKITFVDKFGNILVHVTRNFEHSEFSLFVDDIPVISINYKHKGSEIVFEGGIYTYQEFKGQRKHFLSHTDKKFSIYSNQSQIVDFYPGLENKNQLQAKNFILQSLEEGSNLKALFLFCVTVILKYYTAQSG